jgi:phosphate transport system substrate-binding protein
MNKIIFSAALAATLSLTSCGKRTQIVDTPTSGTEVVACDESFEQIFEQEIDGFEYSNPKASILARYLPENDCIDSLVNGKVRLAVTTRELTDVETDYLKSQRRTPVTDRIAVDAIAVIANPANPIEELTSEDLQLILSGEITTWDKVEPYNKSGDINVVFDYDNSSTVSAIKDKVMDGKSFGKNVFAQKSNRKVFETVSKQKGAIGIIGVSWIASDMSTIDMTAEQRAQQLEQNDTTVTSFNPDIKVLAISPKGSLQAVKPYQAYIYDGTYPLYRSVYLISVGSNGSLARGFANFVKGFAGQKLIQQTGVLPGAMHPRIVQIE